jgi:hypothetical protein
LEKVEKMPWKRADPVIDELDNRIGNLTQTVSTKVASIQNTYQTGKTTVIEGATKTKTNVIEGATKTKATVIDGATKTTEKWKDLRGDLSKKAAERIERGLNQVCEFSATRGKEIIHIDLIQYSREVIDGASSAVSSGLDSIKPVYEPIVKNLAASVLKANEAARNLRQSVLDATDRERLRQRLKDARRAARELSTNSIAYVQAKYGEVAAQSSATLHKGTQFILSSPELFRKIKDKADLDASKYTLENLHNLMVAIREVLLEGPSEKVPTEDVAERSEGEKEEE